MCIGVCVPGGTHLEKAGSYGDVRPSRPPFHALSAVPYETPISACFSSLRPPFQQKSQILQFVVLEPNFTKISVPKPLIFQKKISSLSPLFTVPIRSLSPPPPVAVLRRSSGRTPIPKWKLSTPPGCVCGCGCGGVCVWIVGVFCCVWNKVGLANFDSG